MAAFAQSSKPASHTRQNSSPSSSSRPNNNTNNENNNSTPSRGRALPEGPCNYRDLNTGLPKPPGCGCRRFWWNGEVFAQQESSNASGRLNGEDGRRRNPWCVCGHHACYHDLVERFSRRDVASEESSPFSMAPPRAIPGRAERAGVGFVTQSSVGSQRVGLRAVQGGLLGSSPRGGNHTQRSIRGHDDLAQFSEPRNVTPSDVSTSCLPPLPSFHINSSELQAFNGYEIPRVSQQQAASNPEAAETPAGEYAGLGLTLQNLRQLARQPSQSPTVPDTGSASGEPPQNESQLHLPSTRQTSADEALRTISPDPGFLQRVLEARRMGPRLDVAHPGTTAPALEDLIQSATEIATPSITNTPDFRGIERLVNETRGLVETIANGNVTPNTESVAGGDQSTSSKASRANQMQLAQTSPPAGQPEWVLSALKKIPTVLQQAVPLLTSLHGYLSRNPDVSIHESIISLARRMDSLENASFNQVSGEHVHEQFEMVDGRLIDLENRVDEHGRLIAAFDPENSNRDGRPRRLIAANENASFASNLSGRSNNSATSSALIAAAIDRLERDRRLDNIEERLEDLEKIQPPSMAHPWEIEVVILPWGRELKGIWYPMEELLKPGMTQDSEEWTQARSVSGTHASMSLGTARETGWSDQAIHDWADNTEDWLSPKACGTNGVVYHRLRSRGLVRNITLNSPGARDAQAAICKAFGDSLTTLNANPDQAGDQQLHGKPLLGLSAPFIPLRKVHKSSRLRFLSPTELVTPALWSADFLASGVLMRARAGQKRLFITSREAYFQRPEEAISWTWAKLRELPRVHDPNSQQEAESGSHVPEADAKEPCWANHPALDAPLSIHSSFVSHISTSFHNETQQESRLPSQDLEDAKPHYERADTIQTDPPPFHPITPISEFPTQRSLYHRRTRTVSVPLTDASSSNQGLRQPLQPLRSFPQQAKRRIPSFEPPTNSLIARLPTTVSYLPSKPRSRLSNKRRRMEKSRSASTSLRSRSISLDPAIDPAHVIQHVLSGEPIKPLAAFNTPRLSKEPPSPFFIEGSVEGGASQSTGNVVRVGGKRGITPSAYATPFSGTVGVGMSVDDAEDEMDESEGDDEVWEGVEEHQQLQLQHGIAGKEREDEDEDMEDEGDDSEESEFSMGEEGTGDGNGGLDDGDEDDDMSSQDELHMDNYY